MAEPAFNAQHLSNRRAFPLAIAAWCGWAAMSPAAGFTPTEPVPLRVTRASTAYPGNRFEAPQLVDGNYRTEYASDNLGTNTFCEVDFGRTTTVAAFRHVDRDDRALVAGSSLEFFDEQGNRVATYAVAHSAARSGETFFPLPQPVTARRAAWRVTQLGPHGIGTVGGAELLFYQGGPVEPSPAGDRVQARALPFADRQGTQPARVTIEHWYLENAEAELAIEGAGRVRTTLRHGTNQVHLNLPAVTRRTRRTGTLQLAGAVEKTVELSQDPVKRLSVYIVPHSHTDIGYTASQAEVETRQVAALAEGMRLAERTADYPAGSRFVWNVEALWAAERFLARGGAAERTQLERAVRNGQVELTGMYLNELTGLCRPEELLRLFRLAPVLAQQTGVPIQTAMISDAPGHTWGTVTAMAQAGLRFLSTAPNYGEREFMQAWADQPFYWLSPDGRSKVLVWVPFQGYALSHLNPELSDAVVETLCDHLRARAFPYEVTCLRWTGRGDNDLPDGAICDAVRAWNKRYEWPKLIISGATAPFVALEQKHGKQLPERRGDWTPYWEDGAGSSARETALNRQTAERLVQAQTVFALTRAEYPRAEFDEAWRNVLLFSEHTWGASASVTDPAAESTREQWAAKQAYADRAAAQAGELLDRVLHASGQAGVPNAVQVLNTLSWPRTELVTAPAAGSNPGDRVTGPHGETVPSQRLKTGELVFVAEAVPPLGARQFTLTPGVPAVPAEPARASGMLVENSRLRVRLDEHTGAVVELTARGIPGNLVESAQGRGLNDYIYYQGEALEPQWPGPATIRVLEPGPLVAALRVESSAPGCRSLVREIRLVAGQDHLEIINHVDKTRLAAANYRARAGKESASFAFPFNVPGADLRVDLPLACMRPATDQLPASCASWITPGRWMDVANADFGVAWVTLDAPLVLLTDPVEAMRRWRPQVPSANRQSQFYSWIMNNRWGTNYRAYQEGPVTFRYAVQPHGRANAADLTRLATGLSQPLLALAGKTNQFEPAVRLHHPDVIISSLKPADHGRGIIVRLFGVGGRDAEVDLLLPQPGGLTLFYSDTSEAPLKPVTGPVPVPGFGLVTLRADFK